MQVRFLVLIFVLITASCANKNEKSVKDTVKNEFVNDRLDNAKGFTIENSDDFRILSIKNPWQGAENVEYKYILASENQKIPNYYSDLDIIRTPIKKVVCLSTTHIAFIDVLNETHSIVAVSGAKYVNNTLIRDRIENNEILDIGYDNSLNYELIVSLEPDLVITYGVGGKVAGYNQKLNDLGIQTIVIAEYLENEAMGKLEWIKLLGALYEKDELANSYFDKVKLEYSELKNKAKSIEYKPKVLFGLPWKDVWYVPGGESYLAELVKDAGGNYIWESNDSRESLPFDIESVFAKASNADVWLNTGSINSRNEILKIDERFSSFGPFRKGKIFNNNLITNQFGGNDYWESGLVLPQIVLKDMIKILHPDVFPNHQLVYYKIIE